MLPRQPAYRNAAKFETKDLGTFPPIFRPFWAGLTPDKPEPLGKILTALHCYQITPPSYDNPPFTFAVDRKDHYRLSNDSFPELQKLAAAINKQIPFELDPLTRKLTAMDHQRVFDAHKLQADATSGRALAYLRHYQDLVKQIAKSPTDEFVRPFDNKTQNHPANITVPYAAILSDLHVLFGCTEMNDGVDMSMRSSAGASGSIGSGMRSFSTLAGRNNMANGGTFGFVPGMPRPCPRFPRMMNTAEVFVTP
ncbi:hypothetical protein B0H67DRAFT_638254 [Lasiosphaeris hirsuta]|uniref:Uncharacterized protein n=1 Tax=Lasiosphaeris hirsuta TaxID=260670 RepID=A0AA40B8Q6_9PEZI|nr:hypothetical protein B0H67DRAFT_638254 [Lasiosphaeris hirsuta]